jgi:peptide/nickel transport system substrate-binding protein
MKGRAAAPVTVLLCLVTLGPVLAGCRGGAAADPDGESFAPKYVPASDAARGGRLRVLASAGLGPLDPGEVINQSTYMISFATQRTLLTTSPRSASTLMPDLADGMPESDLEHGRLRVRLRANVRFSPPVNRAVRADDVKYAIERSLLPGIANGEIANYFQSLVGFSQAQRSARQHPRRAPDIAGISCPSPRLIVFQFEGQVPPLAEAALSLPVTAPVPRSYARPFDRAIPSIYGEHVVSSGPYMVDRDESGELTGYDPEASVSLVRNPNWNRTSDFRPAFLDEIDVESGYTNPQTASDKILAGRSMVNGDFGPTPLALESAATDYPGQLMIGSSTANLYASLNTRVPPFNDVNVRRAVVAATDRNAMRLAVGGTLAGHLATHFLPPETAGFEEAGGVAGPGFDFLASPQGDPDLAARYMRRAGYPDGRYDGDARPVMVTDATSQGRRFAEILRQALESLGIPVDVVTVSRDTMYSSFCNVPAKRVASCPDVGWVGQFGDGQTMLDIPFNGAAIMPVNNSNWPLLDVPAVNRAIDRAKHVRGRDARARAWGRIDRQITALAPAVPIVWRDVPYISSADVNLVLERNATTPALPMISLDGD